jgi:hypothetical protein
VSQAIAQAILWTAATIGRILEDSLANDRKGRQQQRKDEEGDRSDTAK